LALADTRSNPEPTPALKDTANPADAAPPRHIKLGESQWALIWREFRHRRLAVVSAYVIVVLATISIFAPFLANSKPILYQGFNRFEYREASRTMGVVLLNLARELEEPVEAPDEDILPEQRQPDDASDPAPAAAEPDHRKIAQQVSILKLQIRLMTEHMPAERAAELREIGDRAVALATAGEAEAAEELRQIRIDIRRQFDGRNIELASGWHTPVLNSLNGVEIAFLVLNMLVLTLPVWRFGVRLATPSDRPGIRNAVYSTAFIGLPLLCAVVWWWTVPSRVDRTNYKAGVLIEPNVDVSQSPVVYEKVLWPVIPYGFDEDNLDAKYLAHRLDPRELFGANAEQNQEQGDTAAEARPWAKPHWLGTDGIGRDVLSRMIWGGRVSLSVGVVAVSIYMVLGIIIGAIAGYFRGTTDMLISRFIEIVICFPSFFLILTIVAFVGPSIFNIMIVIGLTGWTGVARLVRGEFLRLSDQEFVLAARALGYSPLRIIFRHVLPNAMAPVLVSATFGVAGAILTESALSFLGFGITVPQPSWGAILATGREAIFRAPWLIYFPGFAIFLTITAYNLVGEAFRDAADPRLRGQYIRR
jgi:peptide/nickel transport system permease protein